VNDIGGRGTAGAGDNDISLRFGPGVPAAAKDTSSLAETWRAGRQPPPQRRRRRGPVRSLISGLVTIAIVGGVLLWLVLRGQESGLEVTALKVRTPSATQRCDATVDIMGVLTTNGERGQISYRWHRSDGNESGVLSAGAEKGRREVTVPLHWTVTGHGKLHAVAILELLSPGDPRRVSASFDYLCR
jgi:hypothetical protein